MGDLPRFFALQLINSHRYLEYVAEEGDAHMEVRLTSPMVLSETNFTRFERVVSQTSRNLISIKTSFNNRFLRRRGPLGTGNVLAAAADEPEEDRSKWSSTLFRFWYDPSNQRLAINLQSINRETSVGFNDNQSLVIFDQQQWLQIFVVTDLKSLVMLPKHVTFKGDNGLFLRARANVHLRFASSDQTDWRVHHISHILPNGDVRLVSPRFNQSWRTRNSEWITVDGNNTASRETVFRPQRMNPDSKVIALLSRGNNRFCMRWNRGTNANRDYLAASATSSNVPQTLMTVGEAIRSREISDIRYDQVNTRTHDLVPVNITPQYTVNEDYNEYASSTLEFSYQKQTAETFNSSHSWKVSLNASVRVTIIPVLVTGRINFNASYSGSVEWSKTNTSTETVRSSTTVRTPPRSKRRVTLLVQRGSIDVPFSYRQRDTLIDGTTVTRIMKDGLFEGLNTFEVRFVISPAQPLDLSPNDQVPRGIVGYPSHLHQHYDANIVPHTSPIFPVLPSSSPSSEEDNYNDYIVPPTSPIPISAQDSDSDDDNIALRSSKL